MIKTISNIEQALSDEGIARFHYLRGDAQYSIEDGEHKLVSSAYFPADENHPTVLDRSKRTERNQPHVNATDSLYAVWNAAHLIANRVGIGPRNLRKGLELKTGNTPLLPNEEYRLVTKLWETPSKSGIRHGDLEAQFYDGDTLMTHVRAQWVEMKLKS